MPGRWPRSQDRLFERLCPWKTLVTTQPLSPPIVDRDSLIIIWQGRASFMSRASFKSRGFCLLVAISKLILCEGFLRPVVRRTSVPSAIPQHDPELDWHTTACSWNVTHNGSSKLACRSWPGFTKVHVRIRELSSTPHMWTAIFFWLRGLNLTTSAGDGLVMNPIWRRHLHIFSDLFGHV